MLLDPIERKVLKLAGIPLELVRHASRGAAVSRLLGHFATADARPLQAL